MAIVHIDKTLFTKKQKEGKLTNRSSLHYIWNNVQPLLVSGKKDLKNFDEFSADRL